MVSTFEALVVRKTADRTFACGIETRSIDDLPDGDVLVRVHYSTVNFKDGMSCRGNPAVTRRFPHTPGIDAAGIVGISTSGAFGVGDRVMLLSSEVGMTVPGGFGQYIRVPASKLMKLDDALSFEDAMAYGTAGHTAALSVAALLDAGIEPDKTEVVVTGATGGVGCMSVALLGGLGFRVTAVTGKTGARDFLLRVGASNMLGRAEFEDTSGRNLLAQKWDAAIDVAGGNLLSTAIRSLRDGGIAVATGMVQDTALHTTVLPFILRGIRLIGVNAENTDAARRESVWNKMATSWKPKNFKSLYSVIGLRDLPAAIDTLTRGEQVGRIVVDLR